MKLLHLNVKGEYFDQIVSGEKEEEFRLYSKYWSKRLVDREYSGLVIKRGYPKRGDSKRTLKRPWRGCTVKRITHKHFGTEPVWVFAIRVNG